MWIFLCWANQAQSCVICFTRHFLCANLNTQSSKLSFFSIGPIGHVFPAAKNDQTQQGIKTFSYLKFVLGMLAAKHRGPSGSISGLYAVALAVWLDLIFISIGASASISAQLARRVCFCTLDDQFAIIAECEMQRPPTLARSQPIVLLLILRFSAAASACCITLESLFPQCARIWLVLPRQIQIVSPAGRWLFAIHQFVGLNQPDFHPRALFSANWQLFLVH